MASATVYYDTPSSTNTTEVQPPNNASSIVHIGAQATHVTVHMHTHAPIVTPLHVPPSSDVEVDAEHSHLYTSNSQQSTSPSPPPSNHPDRTSESSAPGPNTVRRSIVETLGDTFTALPEGLLSPTVQAVLQQVLRRASESTSPRTVDPLTSNTRTADRSATATQLGQRGQNVAISLMMQPLNADETTPSFTDLFHQLSRNNQPVAQGVPLSDLNRHTEVIVHEAGRGLYDTCAVCQECLESGQVIRRVLHCGHVFHCTCLDKWLEANATCPMCMQSVVPSAVEPHADSDEGTSANGGTSAEEGTGMDTTENDNNDIEMVWTVNGDGQRVARVGATFSPPPPPPPPLRPPSPRASTTTTNEEEEEPVNIRRIPIRLWNVTTAASDVETESTRYTPRSNVSPTRGQHTIIDRILSSALNELTLETIEEDDDEEVNTHSS